jgi:hypothetical protein
MAYQWSSFGHPIYPAQRYMPDTRFSVNGYSGISWPDPKLMWETAFGHRFGLFISAPILLLALYIPGWFKPMRLLGRREIGLVFGFCLTFFLFSAANQFGFVQYNTGVRHIVPVVPFLFLVVAGVFLKIPQTIAVIVAIAATYWSWALAMYREVEYGRGIYEAVIRTTLDGFNLPWLTTLENMGMLPDGLPITLIILLLVAVIVGVIWAVPTPGIAQKLPKVNVGLSK